MDKPSRYCILNRFFEFRCECAACENDWPTFIANLPGPKTGLSSAIFQKHTKIFEKISHGKRHRHSTKTIRSYVQDTKLLLKSYEQPHSITHCFLAALAVILENRYFVMLDVPSTCNK